MTSEPVHPHDRARSWLPADDDPVRPLMTLSTLGLDGAPDARSVLLSAIGPATFAFHTDARSAKVAELDRDPRVCLVLAWPEAYRQLVVHGAAVRQSSPARTSAYGRRSAYLRELAWTNDNELAQLSVADRRARWSAAVAARPDGPIEPPPSWVGFDVLPHRYVFWESGPDVPSHRTAYARSGEGWTITHLAG